MKLLKPLAGLAFVCLMLPLAGCTMLDAIGTALNAHVTNPFNDQQVMQLGNAFGVANSAVVAYSTLPLCAVATTRNADGSACHQKGVLKTMAGDMHVALKAYRDLTAYQRTHPQGSTIVGGTFGTLLSQAKAAVGEVQSLVTLYHLGA